MLCCCNLFSIVIEDKYIKISYRPHRYRKRLQEEIHEIEYTAANRIQKVYKQRCLKKEASARHIQRVYKEKNRKITFEHLNLKIATLEENIKKIKR